MSNQTEYDASLEPAKALTPVETKPPYMPIGIFVQEAENQVLWALKDKDALMGAGIPETHFELINQFSGALRYAQSLWAIDLESSQEAEQIWADTYPDALDFSNHLIHSFRYAYRDNDDLLGNVSTIAEGAGYADTIQDLSDLAVLGTSNPEPLVAINFDMEQLIKADTLSGDLADLRARANGEKYEAKESLVIRNQMYSLLKRYVDDVRACGKYVFWRDSDRLKGYKSAFNTKRNRK